MCRQEKRGLTGGREAAICTMRCTHSGLSAAQNVRKELVPLAGASRGNSQPRSLVGVGGCGSIDWQLVHARGAPPPAAGGPAAAGSRRHHTFRQRRISPAPYVTALITSTHGACGACAAITALSRSPTQR